MSSRSTLEAAFDDHVWRVYGFFAYRVGSREDAEDLTSATFERAVRAFDRYDERRASVATWLMAIAHNLLVDHFRRSSIRTTVPLDDLDRPETVLPATPGPEADLGLSPELALALAQLGDREREIVALRVGGELTGPEIAELTGLTLANVQQILSRALRKLRARLEATPIA